MDRAGTTVRTCPRCGSDIETDGRFVTWCEGCDWNVDPNPPEERLGRLERRRKKLTERHGQSLLTEMTGGATPDPHRSASAVAAFTLALTVHAFTLALVVGGVCLLVKGWATPLMALGVLLLAVAATLLPRYRRLPEGGPVLRRAQAPELFATIDEVGAATGTRGVDVVVLNTGFNASVTTYGLRGGRLLTIGLPLWEILSPQERLALLGHELGHFGNGDTRRGVVLGSALRALSALYYYTEPVHRPDMIEMVSNTLTMIPRVALRGVLGILDRLTLRASQRAEYLADRMAAHVGSSAAAVRLTDRLLVLESAEHALHRELDARQAARRGASAPQQPWAGLWESLAAHVESIPSREYERLRRVSVVRGHSTDTTHPPTHLRRACLQSGGPTGAAVRTDEAREQRIDVELAEPRIALARRVFTHGIAE